MPCWCLGLGLVLLVITLFNSLPQPDEATAFAGASADAPRPRELLTERNYKPGPMDRGTPEYEKYMASRRKIRTAAWEAMNDRDINRVGAGEVKTQVDEPSTGGGGFQAPSFQLPSFSMPSMPAPAPALKPASAPAPVEAGPNPFEAFLQLFQGTTTTTTTTPPPSPLESFLSNFGLR